MSRADVDSIADELLAAYRTGRTFPDHHLRGQHRLPLRRPGNRAGIAEFTRGEQGLSECVEGTSDGRRPGAGGP